MKKYLIGLFIATLLNACTSENKEEHSAHQGHEDTSHAGHQHPQAKELMAIHDSIMPQMGTLMNLEQRLKAYVKTMDSLNTVKTDRTYKQQISQAQALIVQLKTADKSMMGWMHQYKADTLEKLGDNQREKYIEDQKARIQVVRQQMKASITASEAFIQKSVE